MTIAQNTFDQSFEQFLTDCEALMEIATSKQFNKDESFVILLAAKYLDEIATDAVKMFELDIELDYGDKVAKMRLKQATGCVVAVARIISRMQANILITDINLN